MKRHAFTLSGPRADLLHENFTLSLQAKKEALQMDYKTVFDAAFSKELKAQGMSLAASNKQELLAQARQIARHLALNQKDKMVNADQVQQAMIKAIPGYSPEHLGPAAGSIFRGREWRNTQVLARSVRASNHARLLWWWQYQGA